MKKISIITMCMLILLALFAWGTYTWLSDSNEVVDKTSKGKEDSEETLQENRKDIQGTITEEELTAFKEENLNPFGESASM